MCLKNYMFIVFWKIYVSTLLAFDLGRLVFSFHYYMEPYRTYCGAAMDSRERSVLRLPLAAIVRTVAEWAWWPVPSWSLQVVFIRHVKPANFELDWAWLSHATVSTWFWVIYWASFSFWPGVYYMVTYMYIKGVWHILYCTLIHLGFYQMNPW